MKKSLKKCKNKTLAVFDEVNISKTNKKQNYIVLLQKKSITLVIKNHWIKVFLKQKPIFKYFYQAFLEIKSTFFANYLAAILKSLKVYSCKVFQLILLFLLKVI